ncbi:MAG: LacI family DNA-binding transcriptional regulator [Saccharofermentanales bacterium]
MDEKKIKMQDIASRCNVSKALVSRIINGDPSLKIPEATREKILDAVEAMGYIPNTNARLLSKKNEKSAEEKYKIGYITFASYGKLGHPFFSHIIEGMMEEIQKSHCILTTALNIDELGNNYFNKKTNGIPNLDGLIILGNVEDPGLIDYLKGKAKFAVVLDGHFDEKADYVGTDLRKSIIIGLSHLAECGYTNLGMLIGSHEDRLEACREFFRVNNIDWNDQWILNCAYSVDVAYEKVCEKLSHAAPPKAIMAWNDEMAIGCLKALNKFGYKVPEDVAVVGHDDINMAAYSSVSLTTVKIYKEEIGRMAVKILIDRIQTKRSVPIRVEIPGRLKIRESCK